MTSRWAPAAPIVNAMTIDVEDYFHVSVFDGIVPRSDWTRLESRVGRNTDRVLGLFREFNVSATFFVLGWVAEHHPDVVKRIAAAGHEIASHGYAHRLAYDRGRRRSVRTCGGRRRCSRTRPGRRCRAIGPRAIR